MTEQVDQKQRRLKRIVVGLGILLVICFCIVIGTIAYRLSKMSGDEAAEAAVAAPIAMPANTQDLDIALPRGARVIGFTADVANYLVLIEADGVQQVLVVNRSDGTVLQTVRFTHTD